MTILALDQASKVSGWSVFTDGELEAYGIINASSFENVGDRLFFIRKEVKSLLDMYSPDMVLIEDIQMQGGNVRVFQVLAEVYGVIEELLIEEEYPYEPVLAATWKSTLGIKGRKREEQKANAYKYVSENYGLVDVVQDVADSICINAHYNLKNKKNGFDWS